MRRTNVIRAAALGAASLLGGLIALGGVTLTGDLVAGLLAGDPLPDWAEPAAAGRLAPVPA